jgi:anti-sigma factor RsiW
MSCNEARELIDDYVDGTLDEAAFQEMELHVAGCAACRAEERSLRALLAHAAALPAEIAPERDLWAGIDARIEAVRPIWRRPRLLAGWGAVLAAAAGVVLALSAALHGPAGSRVTSPVSSLVPAALRGDDPVAAAEREYARAAAELMAALEQRRGSLPPETLASVERDMRSIDAALAEVRRALAADPSNPGLNHLLTSTHQRKVEVLQQVLKLSRT